MNKKDFFEAVQGPERAQIMSGFVPIDVTAVAKKILNIFAASRVKVLVHYHNFVSE